MPQPNDIQKWFRPRRGSIYHFCIDQEEVFDFTVYITACGKRLFKSDDWKTVNHCKKCERKLAQGLTLLAPDRGQPSRLQVII